MQSQFLECKPCGKKFTGKECMEQHMVSAKHLKKANQEQFKVTLPERNLGKISSTTEMKSGVEENLRSLGEENESGGAMLQDSNVGTSDTELLTFLNCEICSLPPLSIPAYAMHVKSKEHIEAVKLLKGFNLFEVPVQRVQCPPASVTSEGSRSFFCEICNISCTGQKPFDMHLASVKHIRKESQKTGGSISSSNIPSERSIDKASFSHQVDKSTPENINYMICELCEVSCTGRISYEMHLGGEKHKKKMNQSISYRFADISSSGNAPADVKVTEICTEMKNDCDEESMDDDDEYEDLISSIDNADNQSFNMNTPSICEILSKQNEFIKNQNFFIFRPDDPIDFVKIAIAKHEDQGMEM